MTHKNLVLIGFMGTGKSQVGRLLAGALGMTFVDTDTLIEKRTGTSIPVLFAERGEPAFRAIEKEVVCGLSGVSGHVIATGGGAVIDHENLAALRTLGTLVHLQATPEVILQRTGGNAATRPMLAGPDAMERIRALLETRAPYYAQADFSVNTTDKDVYCVARNILVMLDDGAGRNIRVDLREASYDIRIGEGLLPRIGLLLRAFRLTGRALVVTHRSIRRIYGEVIETALRQARFEPVVAEIPEGESQKSLSSASRLYDAMLNHRMDRRSPVIALGGGVIGDLTGFAAATYMRGIPFVQVPTTLLAQVDASVGGKVAVDHPRGKNLIGAFYQPLTVLVSLDTLGTLPDHELRAGMAEVIKYGVIADAGFFAYLEANIERALLRDPAVLQHLVSRSCEIKAQVVSGDEKEEGRRAILNFGHTIGHAIETRTGVLHGEAVAAGMVYAARIAQRLGIFDKASVLRLIRLIERAGLPIRFDGLDPDALSETMMHDKKAVGGQLRFILPVRIGDVEIRGGVKPEDIRAAILDVGF
ncbi:MAG: 3-dehydroquinate synthase [candidate division Zixibacteria bacterium]|nr:3-dehydroquinate synthase [candidate division Zixibacteria bacterium]